MGSGVRFGVGVCLVHEAIDGSLNIADGSEDATLEALVGELGEEAFDGIQPGGRGWCKVEGQSGMLGDPFAHVRILVARVVVDDGWLALRSTSRRTGSAGVPDAVLDEVREWQNRPLDAVYPVIFFDALRVKIRERA